MWSKLSNVLKSKQTHDGAEQSSSQGDVMSRVLDQHPNLSVFHSATDQIMPTPSPPSSPSKHGRRGMFKRMSRAPFQDDNDSLRAPSPMIGQPKKVKPYHTNKNGNNSQLSLSRLPTENGSSPHEMTRRSSFDMLRPSNDTIARPNGTTKSATALRRPSLDLLRFNQEPSSAHDPSHSPHPSEDGANRTPITPSLDAKYGSVRSILRDPKTPGTGQNVRFFSRDAYKVISPDQSMDPDFHQQQQQQTQEQAPKDQESFLERLSRGSPEGSNGSALTRASSGGKTARPTVAEVFSPLSNTDTPPSAQAQANFINSTNLLSPIPPPDFNLFGMSEHLELPKIPPGLGFDVPEPALDSAVDMSLTDDGRSTQAVPSSALTSTPFKDKGKGKAKDAPSEISTDNAVMPIDETIFHAKEKSPRLPAALHDRSQSFSFGQTVFHSLANTSRGSADDSFDTSGIFASASANLKPSLLNEKEAESSSRATSPVFTKNRGRALSDTVFQSMMRSSPKPPEADINDESSQDLVVYSGTTPEQPDPFRANATTYYTPQTMIPVTPPQGALTQHIRKTSKEENIIFSLQTQLALQTELCQQYETDLRARDELVEILGKKVTDMERDETKRKGALRGWKKKVQDLEKTCRYLEEEVEGSRQNSMERSIMDEASGEALRMLHRQIAVLEREKSEWGRNEEMLRDEVATLENLVKDRTEDVMSLKEMLWSRDESERELKEGIREAKEQMEMMGNVSMPMIDEEELKKLIVEKEQRGEEERERHRVAEFGWEEERTELVTKVHNLQDVKVELEGDLETTKDQLRARTDEYELLKAELNAQWEHTEKATEKIEGLEKAVLELQNQRDALKRDLEELEHRGANMDAEWNETEAKKAELENELQEVWNYKDELEKEREQLEDQLQQERDHSNNLLQGIQERDNRISEVDQERQFAQDNVARLEEKLRQRNDEITEYSQRAAQHEAEAEQLREEMVNLRREHSRVVDEQSRALQEVSLQEGEARTKMEALVRQQAAVEVEMKTSKDKISALKEEVERLRRQIHELQQASADKEVKLVQLAKQRAKDKEDLNSMNIALDSKQQELELIKRNLGVRGTGGSTPAPASRIQATHGRRDSAIFKTPTISRPSSVMSDTGSTTGKERKLCVDSTPAGMSGKVSALGKSIRVNGTTSSTSTSKRIEGSMGPPPPKPRMSVAGTPTPAARVSSLSRSSSMKPTIGAGATAPHRRVSSVEQMQPKTKLLRPTINASPAPSVSEHDEKENVDLSSRRRSMLPIPA
ncbi:Calcium-binding and coiled-coil domain-containing protein 1 [Hypsizygus marmoreus]|uniref:Calcium-binding and coiled-coil domain-containing protein 1 n=1 Tax=Hypsizygus marmoreus TaxID=39966 RepID=A0A369JPZ5_HYPMA|nr:Calcium-binding and coiled-coil domain-containing protein 1 [Hypsizygus marmoreus]